MTLTTNGEGDPANGPDALHTFGTAQTDYPGITHLGYVQVAGIDSDSDGIKDGYDADPYNDAIKWAKANFHRYSVEEVGQNDDIGDPIDVNDRGDILFRRNVWRRGQSLTPLAQPGSADYKFVVFDGPSQEWVIDDRDVDTFWDCDECPDNERWDPLTINNSGAVIGNAHYKNADISGFGGFYRGIYWPDPGTAVVTNPKEPFDVSSTLFYSLGHDHTIVGVDTQEQWPVANLPIPPIRQDLVKWGKGSRPTRLAKYIDLSFSIETGVFHRTRVEHFTDHAGNIIFGDWAYRSNQREEFSHNFLNDIARIGESEVLVGDTGGMVDGTAVSELKGKRISPSGVIIRNDGLSVWLNGVVKLLDYWVEPDPALQEYRKIEGFAVSDSGVIAAVGRKDGSRRILLLRPEGPPKNRTASANDATGPRYRKVALTGLPLSDEAPQATEESDQHKEQTYIDAFNRALVHHTSDIYVPVPASELILQVTRSYQEEIWNQRHGMKPNERFDRPFGAGWTSSICSYIEFVERNPTGATAPEPTSVRVVDEEGRSQSFGTYNSVYYFPMPSGRVEKKTYLNTLTKDATGDFIYKKKFGNTLTFEPVTGVVFSDDIDRASNDGGTQTHTYARLKTVTDRYGNTLTYSYTGNALYPDEIAAGQGRDLKIEIEIDANGLVEWVKDPRGYVTNFDYSNPPSEAAHALWKVIAPGPNQATTTYVYEYQLESNDHHPRAAQNRGVDYRHLRLCYIKDARGKDYNFDYALDSTKHAYHTDASGDIYLQTGLPSLVQKVHLPTGTNTTFAYSPDPQGTGEPDWTNPPEGAPPETNLTISSPTSIDAYKMTCVKDAEGNYRWYEFTDTDTLDLAKLPGNKRPDDDGSSTEMIVSYQTLSIETQDVGTETYHFDPNAGYALAKSVDINGNTTLFEYNSEWDAPDAYRYITNSKGYGSFDDPTAEVDALGQVKTFDYEGPDKFRMMKEIVDVDGSTTSYGIDHLGRRTSETITDPNGNTVQETFFAYHSSLPAFLERRTIKRHTGDPAWAQDRVITYVPFTAADTGEEHNIGRVKEERVLVSGAITDPNPDELVTVYDYDANGNRTSVTDPRQKTTQFVYDERNRLDTTIYPDSSTTSFEYDKNSNRIESTDERSITTTFIYDNLNRLEYQIVDLLGLNLETHFVYNAVGSLEEIKDPRGFTTIHVYDKGQRRTRTKTPHGGTPTNTVYAETVFDYSGENAGASIFNSDGWKPTKIIDPRTVETLVTYDPLYRVVRNQVQQEVGGSDYTDMVTTYDDATRTVTTREKVTIDGTVTWLESETVSDALGRTVSSTIAKGVSGQEATTVNHYTTTGLHWQTVDPLLAESRIIYDLAGRPTQSWTPDPDTGLAGAGSLATLTEYDPNGNVIAVTDPRGVVWNAGLFERAGDAIAAKYTTSSLYDSRNRRTAVIEPKVTITTTPGVTTETHPATLTEYDAAGNIEKVVDPRGTTVTGNFATGFTNVTESTTGYATSTTYDNANRPETVTLPAALNAPHPSGAATTSASTIVTTYDDNGNPETVTDGNGVVTNNTYDAANRLHTTTTGGITVTNTYDLAGNLEEIKDGLNQITEFTFDGLNRKTATIFDPGTNEDKTTLTYNEAYLVTRSADNGGNDIVTKYAYDSQKRLTGIDYENRTDDNQTRGYDLVGNLETVIYTTGTERNIIYDYDKAYRLTEETSAGSKHTCDYDDAGNRTDVTYAGGRDFVYTFNGRNQITGISDNDSTITTDTTYGFDLAGNQVEINQPDGSRCVQTFDARSRLTKTTLQGLAPTRDRYAEYRYLHDHAGNIREVAERYDKGSSADQAEKRLVKNTYDDNYRLDLEVDHHVTYNDTAGTYTVGSAKRQVDYAYDDAHNRTDKNVTIGGTTTQTDYTIKGGTANSNQVTKITTGGADTDLVYDSRGNRIIRNQKNSGGTTTHYTHYQYDHDNRLVTLAQWNSQPTLENGEPKTDTNGNYTTTPANAYSYLHDYRTRRVTRTENGLTTKVSYLGGTSAQEYEGTTLKVEYIRGADLGGGIGGILYTDRAGTGIKHFHYNHRGDVTLKTTSTSHNNADKLDHVAVYEAFGEAIYESPTSTDRQQANTKERDPHGLIHSGFRERDGHLFISRDPAGFVDTTNLYSYVACNPTTYWDPLGLKYSKQFDNEGYLKTEKLKDDELKRANRFNDSWKRIRETKAGKALHRYLKGHKQVVSVRMESSAQSPHVLDYYQGAKKVGAQVIITKGRPMDFNVTAEEMIHVGQKFAAHDFEADNKKPESVNAQNLAEFNKWQSDLTKAEGGFIPELPLYVSGDDSLDLQSNNDTDGSKEAQAMRGVNILRYELYKLKRPNKITEYVRRPAHPSLIKSETRRLHNFSSMNQGVRFFGNEFGGYEVPELKGN